MLPGWKMIDALLGGTAALREAGPNYLPKHPAETADDYRNRLACSVLLNVFERTLDTLAGKPFSEQVKVNEDVPAQIVDRVLDDVDLMGNDLTCFLQSVFRCGLAKGLAHVLTEYPRMDEEMVSYADTTETRPYFVLIPPESLLFARCTIIGGREVLTHVRIKETLTEPDGYIDKEIQQIRVMDPGHTQLFRKGQGANGWTLADEWDTGLDFVPIATYYTGKLGFMLAKPPMLDLAYLNIRHWQSSSDQQNILTVSRFPLLACSGGQRDDVDTVIIGPNRVLYTADPAGKFYYVEHTGAAIEAGRRDLQDLEDRMMAYGAEFLRRRPGGETATARALSSAEASADLQSMITSLEDFTAQILWHAAAWMGLETGGTVEIQGDVHVMEDLDKTAIEAIQRARERGDISRAAWVDHMKDRRVLREDFDAEMDAEKISQEVSVAP
jgi:hypothetical protein